VRGELPTLSPPPPPPARTVEVIRHVLDVPQNELLLGCAQALLDGGKLVFERNAPDAALVRSIWMLLPTASRGELWPATFAFGNALGFHVIVTHPGAVGSNIRIGSDFTGYLNEEQLSQYPEGAYERSLWHAADTFDQAELNKLFSRRSRGQTLKLAIILLLIFLLGPVLVSLVFGPSNPPPAATTPAEQTTAPEKQP
jgi:hypothetical protein